MIDTKTLRPANSKLHCDLLNKDMFNIGISTTNIVRLLKDFSSFDLPAKIWLGTSSVLFKGKRQVVVAKWYKDPINVDLQDQYFPYVVPVTSDMITHPETAAKTLLAGYYQHLVDCSAIIHEYVPAQAAWQIERHASQMLFSKKEYTDWLIPKLSYLRNQNEINNRYLCDNEYVAKSILAYADTYHSLRPEIIESIMGLFMFASNTKHSIFIKKLIQQILCWLNTPNFIKYNTTSTIRTLAYRTLLNLCHECDINQVTLPFNAIFYLAAASTFVSGKYELLTTFDSIIFKIVDDNDFSLVLSNHDDKANVIEFIEKYPNIKVDYNGYKNKLE